MSLALLQQEIGPDCKRCTLSEFRTRVVFGEGPEDAKIMVVGEAPGADEDASGRPFVGASGRLLTTWLTDLGIPREKVYIANIAKCRPLDNRDPEPEEVATCSPFLRRQIQIIQPKLLLAVGKVSSQFMAKQTKSTTMKWMREQEFWYEDGPLRIPLGVTYHPSYELQSRGKRAQVRALVMADLTRALRRVAPQEVPPVEG